MSTAQQNRPEALDDRCLPKYRLLDNDFGQNPCEVARILVDLCQPRAYYSLPALDLVNGQTHYQSPNPGQATECQCSMGVYNLVQGCAACQQDVKFESTLWTDWVSNCTMSMINNGQVFPYSCPAETEIPPWAWQNNANGALSVGQVFRNAYGNSNGTSSSSSSTTASPTSTATTDVASQKTAPSSSDGSISKAEAAANTGKSVLAAVLGALVPVLFIALVAVGVCVYMRKRKRRFRGRGHQLDSSADLPVHGGGDFGSDATSSTAGYSAEGLMKQKDSRLSVFARPVSSLARTSSAARSFATNSVSTGAPVGAFHHHRESTLYSASTGFDTLTRSSAFSYDPSDESYHDHGRDEDASSLAVADPDDDSISPFSDIHRPAPTHTTTRDNIHRAPSSSSAFTRSYSSFSLSASTAPSLVSRGGPDPDAASLLTTASSSRGAPPSSSGATYGGAYDDDDEDGDEEGEADGASLRGRSSLRR